MILLWGAPGDGPFDAVSRELTRLRADVRVLDQRQASQQEVSTRVVGRRLVGTIVGPGAGGRLDLEDVHAVYLRPVETERALPSSEKHGSPAHFRAQACDRVLIAWCDLTTAVVVNRPASMAANNSKPFQLQQIASHGFDVPDTLVTTDPQAVRAFLHRHERIIYKSISGVRSIVSVLGPEGLARLDDVAHAPTQFQEHVPGVDVRVHVVGAETFATEARTGADDYRYASRTGHTLTLAAVSIPEALAERCRRMAAAMGLIVAGIDLRHTPDGRWVCFEVNPSPAFVFYEEATAQPIAAAIARTLMSADGRARDSGRDGSAAPAAVAVAAVGTVL